jgi:uncharacterized protein (DUF1778 family)
MGKTSRLNIRVTEEQHATLRAAAEQTQMTVSDYVLDHVLADAESELIDRHRFVVDAPAWRELQALIDGPAWDTPALDRVRARPPLWERGADIVFRTTKQVFIVQVKSDAKDAVRVAAGIDLADEDGWETIVVGAVEERDEPRSA